MPTAARKALTGGGERIRIDKPTNVVCRYAENPGRTSLSCPDGRENLFRGLLFFDCCGHPLTLSRKKLKDRVVDIYLCTYHNRRPDECPKTHIIYHEELYPYILEQLRALARSMKRRKVNSPICRYVDIDELTHLEKK